MVSAQQRRAEAFITYNLYIILKRMVIIGRRARAAHRGAENAGGGRLGPGHGTGARGHKNELHAKFMSGSWCWAVGPSRRAAARSTSPTPVGTLQRRDKRNGF